MIKLIYHKSIAIALKLVGLDFSWYLTFYRSVIFALPIVEPIVQLTRLKLPGFWTAEHRSVISTLKPGDTVLDIGANVGNVTSAFLGMGLVVHAFEPDSRCIALLQRRFQWFGHQRLHLHHCAVSNKPGRAKLNYGLLTTESSSIVPDKPGADGTAGMELVEMRSIVDIVEEIGYVTLIKMDIEGAEYDVLEALLQPEKLDKFGVCLVEVHAKKIPSLLPRHKHLEETIASLNLQERILLTWH